MFQENNNGSTPRRLTSEDINGPLGSGQPIRPETGLTGDSNTIRRLTSKELSEGFGSDIGGAAPFISEGSIGKYEKILGEGMYHPELGDKENMYRLHTNQSVGGQFANFLGQVGAEIAGGTIEGLGYISDLGAGVRLANESQAEFGNDIADFGASIKDFSKEIAPIYIDPYKGDQFDPGSWSWWMTNGVSVASTISLMLPSMVATRGAMILGDIAGLTSKLSATARVGVEGVTQALFSRHAENMMEASGVYKENYKKALDSGMSDVDAKKMASLAASNTYNKQWALLVQDIPQYILLNKIGTIRKSGLPSGTPSKITGWFGKENQLATTAGKVGAIAFDQAMEGGEEIFQFLVNEQSNVMIDNELNPNRKQSNSLLDVLKKNYDSGEMWTSGFFGAIGAGVMQAGFAGLNHSAINNTIKKQMEDLTRYSSTLNQANAEYSKALESGDPIKQAEALPTFLLANRMKNIIHGTKDYTDKMLDELEKGITPELAAKWGVDIETQNRLKNDPEFAKTIREGNKKIDNLYESFKKEVAGNKKIVGAAEKEAAAQLMTHAQFILDESRNNLKGAINRRATAESALKDFNSLSKAGQAILINESEKRAQQLILDSQLKQKAEADKLTDNEKEKAELEADIIESEEKIKIIDANIAEAKAAKKKEKVLREDGKEVTATANDKTFVIDPEQLDAYNRETGRVVATRRSIERYEKRLEDIRSGKKTSQVQIDSLKEALGVTDEPVEKEPTKIDVGDTAEFIAEDGKTKIPALVQRVATEEEGKDIKAKLINKAETLYIVQPLDPVTMEAVGDPIVKAGMDLFIAAKQDNILKQDPTPDPLEKDEVGLLGEMEAILDESDEIINGMSPISNISYSDKDKKTGRPITRHEKLSKVLNSKKTNLSLANVTYKIDTSSKAAKDNIRRFSGTLTEEQKVIFEKFIEGKKALDENEIDILLTAISKDKYTDFVDIVPISVSIKVGGELYEGGLTLHTSSFPYIKIPKSILKNTNKLKRDEEIAAFQQKAFSLTRKNREDILRVLLSTNKDKYGKVTKNENGEVVRNEIYTKGLNRSRGTANSGNTNRKLTDVLGTTSNNIRIAIGISDESTPYKADLRTAFDSYETGSELSISGVGNAYAILAGDETLNGEKYALKLNRPFISMEHADILFDAFLLVGRYGTTVHPYAIKFQGSAEVGDKDTRVAGLGAGHVLDLLVNHGRDKTDPTTGRFKSMTPDPRHAALMRHKQLYIDREGGGAILRYGWDESKQDAFQIDLMMKNIPAMHAQKAHFMNWITTNKRYAIHLKYLGSGSFFKERTFRIGEEGAEGTFVRERNKETKLMPTYKEFIIDNGLVVSDAARDEEGSLFHNPVISANLTTPAGALNWSKFGITGQKGRLEPPKRGAPKVEDKVEKAPEVVVETNVEQPPIESEHSMVPDEIEESRNETKKPEKKVPYTNRFSTKKERTLFIDGVEASLETTTENISKISAYIESLIKSGEKLETVLQKVKSRLAASSFKFMERGTKQNKNIEAYIRFRFAGDTTNTLAEEFNSGLTKDEPIVNQKETSLEVGEDDAIEIIVDGKSFVIEEADSGLSAEEQEMIKQAAKEDAPDSVADAMGRKKYDNEPPFAKKAKEGPYKVQDIHKDIQWAYDIVGIKPEDWDIKRRLVDMLYEGRLNFALYSQSSIKLFEAAEVGTVYHEAFHRVSLGYFSKIEREQMYRAARKIYNLNTEKYSDKQVEEFLADKFENFVISNGTQKAPGAIQKFFQPLFDFIKRIFGGKKALGEHEIDRIFRQISRGDYKGRKVLEENKNILKPGEYAKTIIGENLFNNLDTRNEVKDLIKGLTLELFELNNVKDLDDVAYLKHSPLIAQIKQWIFNLDRVSRNQSATELERENARNLKMLYEEVLGDKDLKTGRYENYGKVIKPQIDSFLSSMGIKQKGTRIVGEEYLEEEESNTGVSTEDEGRTENVAKMGGDYHKESYERSHKDTARNNIKFMIATLREGSDYNSATGAVEYSLNRTTGLGTFVDFNKTWSKLFNSIHWINNIDDMILELRAIATEERYVPFFELANKLDNESELVRDQFFTTVRSSKHDFINFSARKNGDKYDFTINRSAINEGLYSKIAVWNELFFYDDRITYKELGEDNQYHTYFEKTFFERVGQLFSELKAEIAGYNDQLKSTLPTKEAAFIEEKLPIAINSVLDLLQRFNIDVDEATIRRLISKQKGENLNNDLDRLYSYVSGELKQVFANISKKVGNRALNFSKVADSKTPIDRKSVSLFKNNVIRGIAKAYIEAHPEELDDTQLGAGKTNFYSFSGVSHIKDEVDRLQNEDGYAEAKVSRVYKRRSRILNDMIAKSSDPAEIARAENRKRSFGLLSFSYLSEEQTHDTGRNFIEITELEDYLVKLTAIFNVDKENPDDTMLPLPSLPRKGYMFMKGVRRFSRTMDGYKNGKIIFSKEVLDYFFDAYTDEIERVNDAVALRDSFIKAEDTEKERLKRKLRLNYHFTGDVNNMNLSKGNAYQLIHFKGFEADKKGGVQSLLGREDFNTRITNVLNKRVFNELDYAAKIKVINKLGEKEYSPRMLDEDYISEYATEFGEDNSIGTIGAISDFSLNYMMAVLEAEKVFFADPAFFAKSKITGEVWEDLYKRWFGVGASGTAFSETTKRDPYTDYNILVLNTQKFKAPFYETMLPKHIELWKKHLTKNNKKNLTTEQIATEATRLAEMRLSEYKKVDATDGQSWISPTMYKKLLLRSGNFTPRVEAAFNQLISDEELTPETEIKLLAIVLNPQKTVYVGTHEEDGMDVLIYDKMSMAILFNRLAKGTHMEDLYDRMELKGKYANRPELNKIDAVNFTGVTKIGETAGYDFFVDGETRTETHDLSKVILQKRYWRNLRNQLTTDSKENFTEQTMGSAVFKISSSNVQKTEKYGDFATGMDMLNAMTLSRIAVSNMGRNEVDAILGIQNGRINNLNLIRMLREDAKKAKKSDDFIRNLKVDKNGRLGLQLDAFPDRRWIYSRLMTLVTNKTIDLNTPGAQLIQTSSYGLSNKNIEIDDTLKFTTLEDGAEQTTQMECRVSIRLFKHLIKNYEHLSHEERVKEIQHLNIPLLGYRTPTQGQNSIISLKIAKFEPDEAGDVVYLPLEFTALSGSDFDIDKLFMMYHNYERKDGKIQMIKFDSNMSEASIEKRYNDKIEELYKIFRKDHTVFSKEVFEKLRSLKEIEIGYISDEELEEISDLLHPENLVDVTNARAEHSRLWDEYDATQDSDTKENIYQEILAQESLIDSILSGNVTSGKVLSDKRIFELKKATLLKYKKIGSLKDFSALSIEEQNTAKANQNRIIDIFHTIIRDEKHFLSTSQPLGGIKNQIVALSAEVEAAENKGKSLVLDALGSTTPQYQADVKFKYVTSTKGVVEPSASRTKDLPLFSAASTSAERATI
jgi:hypothetical protein